MIPTFFEALSLNMKRPKSIDTFCTSSSPSVVSYRGSCWKSACIM